MSEERAAGAVVPQTSPEWLLGLGCSRPLLSAGDIIIRRIMNNLKHEVDIKRIEKNNGLM